MTEATQGEVTRLLGELRGGDKAAWDRLFSVVYPELRRIARRQIWGGDGRTVQPTMLVHEAYLKLAGQTGPHVEDRAHFYAVAARAMRQILIDRARRRAAVKRGGEVTHTTLDENGPRADLPVEELLALDQALERLGEMDPRARQVVEYRYFLGMTDEEAAGLLGISPRAVRRDWTKARAWLHKELYPGR